MVSNMYEIPMSNYIEYQAHCIHMMGAGCLFRDIIKLGGIPCLPHPQMN